jgi:polysaccharide export outer membrane protein
VFDQAAKQQTNFAFVEVDPHVIAALSAEPSEYLRSRFKDDGKAPSPTIGVGDVLSITIWDSASGSIFGTSPAETTPGALLPTPGAVTRSVVLPDQVVAPDGAISVPYAGRIPVANRTPLQVQRTIQRLLAKSAFEPEVLVTVVKSVAGTVTVSGEFMSGARVPLTVRGDRLLDVIAAAGGTKSAPYETIVRLTRHGVTGTVPLTRLLSDPSENIYAMPGDIVTLSKVPETFSVFGATLNNLQVPFGADQVNLAQAIAKAGGLQDTRADPSGVFLFRFEPPPVVAALGEQNAPVVAGGASPVVYHLNLRDVGSYFLAKEFPVRNDDMIYVADAPMTELQKFFTLVGTISGPVISGVLIGKGQ